MSKSARPRVLQVVLSLNPGGTERLVLDLVGRLHDEIPMSVCCLDGEGAWACQLRDRGVVVSSLHRSPGFHPGLGQKIHALARHHGATLMHAHHYSPFVYSSLAKIWSPRTQLVFTEHGRVSDDPPSRKRRFANRVMSMFPARVFSVSEDLRRHIVAEGFAPDQVEVIHNGIAIRPLPDAETRAAIRARLNVDDSTLVVGTVARLDPVKDLGTLIEATALIRTTRPVRLVIVGDGQERAALERLVAERRLASDVSFLGHRDDARDWLAGCDLFVNCSISEGVSLTILEAMAAGLPVIATRVGGTPEVVTPDCGVLVPPRAPRAIADALAQSGQDASLRASFGAAARRRAETLFSLDRMIRRYRDVYMGAA